MLGFIDGLAGSAFLSVAGGTVGDMFTRDQLSAPMMVYTASPFVGPEVGPVIGGFINQFYEWRWSFWVLVIVSLESLQPVKHMSLTMDNNLVVGSLVVAHLLLCTGDVRTRAPETESHQAS